MASDHLGRNAYFDVHSEHHFNAHLDSHSVHLSDQHIDDYAEQYAQRHRAVHRDVHANCADIYSSPHRNLESVPDAHSDVEHDTDFHPRRHSDALSLSDADLNENADGHDRSGPNGDCHDSVAANAHWLNDGERDEPVTHFDRDCFRNPDASRLRHADAHANRNAAATVGVTHRRLESRTLRRRL